MKRVFIISFLAAYLIVFHSYSVLAETPKGEQKTTEPDSAYVDKGESKPEEGGGGGGLLDFLPFFGGHSKKAIEPERLTPSPLPEASKPVLSKNDLEELRAAANQWLTTSEITEPKVRADENGKYYRDYVVFANDYKIDVLRGVAKDRPFVANVYVQGDYFKTNMYDDSAHAEADFDFKYQPLEFRVVFERVEKWEYSASASEEPIRYTRRWEFRKLQSRAKVDLSEKNPAPAQPGQKSDVNAQPTPQPIEKKTDAIPQVSAHPAEKSEAAPQTPPQPAEKGDATPQTPTQPPGN